jgi:hypothetical protein
MPTLTVTHESLMPWAASHNVLAAIERSGL